MSGVQKISRFNRERFGTANNESDYPTLAQRQVFARAMAARSAEAITASRKDHTLSGAARAVIQAGQGTGVVRNDAR
jgi:hypothetical protein